MPDAPRGDDRRTGEGIPYMLENTPEELDRVRAIAAERHRQEAERLRRLCAAHPDCPGVPSDRCSICPKGRGS